MAHSVEEALCAFPTVGGNPPRRIGYVVNFPFHTWYRVVQEYMQARAHQYGIEHVVIRDAHGDLSAELAALEDLAAAGVEALVVTPVPGPGTEAIVGKASAVRLPLVIEANPVAGMATMVAICDYDAGVKAGRWAGQRARRSVGKPPALLDIAFPSLGPCLLRSEGFFDGLRSVVTGSTLVQRVNGEASAEVAERVSLAALREHPEINVIFGMDDESLLGGLRAADALGRGGERLIAVGFGLSGDENKVRLRRADSGKGSLAMFPEWVGARCVDQVVRLLNGHPVALHDIVPTVCLSPDTLGTYYQEHGGRWYPDFTAIRAIAREDRCTRT